MVRSADTTAAQSAALIAAHAALTGYLLVNLLVLILPPCGHQSRHSEDTTGACSGRLLVNLLVLILRGDQNQHREEQRHVLMTILLLFLLTPDVSE